MFGEFDKITKISVKSDYVNLKIFIQKIQIQIVLSTNKKYIPKNVLNKKVYQFRKIKIDKKNLEFSKNFNNLHIKIYNKFIKNKGWNSDQILYVIKTLNKYFKV